MGHVLVGRACVRKHVCAMRALCYCSSSMHSAYAAVALHALCVLFVGVSPLVLFCVLCVVACAEAGFL